MAPPRERFRAFVAIIGFIRLIRGDTTGLRALSSASVAGELEFEEELKDNMLVNRFGSKIIL
jgi:hypothetical protein